LNWIDGSPPEPFSPLLNYRERPALLIIPALVLAAAIITGVLNRKGEKQGALRCSFVTIADVFILDATLIFPKLVPASNNMNLSLTIADSSSPLTLLVMLIIALIGMPIVVWYTIWIHRLFANSSDSRDSGD
jgi:cytochrome d ubiquinol oxidase subunit II